MELVEPPRIVVVGEGMLELAETQTGGWALGYGGDTLNTAIHLVRLGNDVAFATALGTDAFSHRLRRAWADEGLDLSLTLEHPGHEAGLYAISLDPRGERSFTYWRGQSAARQMFALPASPAMIVAAAGCELLYFSLITLAILPPAGRKALIGFAAEVRARGGRVAFDGNYRPRLWESREAAIAARDEAIGVAGVGLPTFDDEAALSGAEDPHAVAAHWRALGCAETVVKLGADGCLLADGNAAVPAERLQPVDTSGAGDAFNAGYLSARLAGADPAIAARHGHALAGWTVMRRGAIPACDADAPYAQPIGAAR